MRWLLLLCLASQSVFALPALVQSKSIASAAVTSNAVALTSATVAGHTLVAFVRMSTSTASATITGTSGETWTLIASQPQVSNSHTTAMFYATGIPGGSDTVTATYNASNAHAFLAVWELSGVSILDQFTSVSSGATTSTAASVGPTGTTTNADEFVIAGFGQPSTTTDTPSAGTGYTLSEKNTSNVADAATEYQIVSSTGTQTAVMNYTVAIEYSAIIATFKAAPAAVVSGAVNSPVSY